MKKSARDASTLRGEERAPSVGAPRALALTILYHPDPSRIGEIAIVEGDAVRLSRLEPEFGPAKSPLDEPHVSRKPLRLAAPGGRLKIDAPAEASELSIDGRKVSGSLETDLPERGRVLEVGTRVVLLLHRRVRPKSAPPAASLGGLLGGSEAVDRLRDEIARVADLEVPVLLRGETGSGKELVARAVHAASRRASRPFVAVNMATLPAATAPSQLFGHARGAFTGAAAAHRGFFEEAAGGTLFLDEIADASSEVQAMLLRALEEKAIRPLGATQPLPVDVRLLAATDANLERARDEGRFRGPLLHRLAGYTLQVPPLAARPDDVARLLVHFLREELAAAGEPDRLRDDPPWLPAALVARLVLRRWAGNVRELKNIARRIVVAGRGGRAIDVDLDDGDTATAGKDGDAAPAATLSARPSGPLDDAAILAALEASHWSTGAAATALGISRTTLYARMERCAGLRKAKDVGRPELAAAIAATGGDLERMSATLKVSQRGLKLRMKELGL